VLACALAALAAWPAVQSRASAGDPAAAATPAPLRDDALIRDKTIAFEESRLARDPQDQITPRLLAADYVQRYRERLDPGDVLRARAAAERSLRRQPERNVAALQALASAQLALHRFRDALATVRRAERDAPADPSLRVAEAAVRIELGEYDAARRALPPVRSGDDGGAAVAARLAELTGDLPQARALLERAARNADATYGIPNERRAWFHLRLGELAFEAGDGDAARAHEQTALARFPDDVAALTDLARFDAAAARWADARAAAERAVRITPWPEALAILADAQERLGDGAAAAATRDEIVAVERIGNAQHLFDRLVALAYADRGVRAADAYAIARRELAVRDDVFAEDTLAWTAARTGHWEIARAAAARATRWNTPDPRIWYHAGVVAEHVGDRVAAVRDFDRALALNPSFHPVFADDARRRLAADAGLAATGNPPGAGGR
jgi:tetratricopeptide (TPR) repeat protein